jgi:hypothetical protein
MKLLTRRQKFFLLSLLVATLALGIVPPWKYANGQFIGFRPVFSPPPAAPDSIALSDVRPEHVPIQIVPQSLYRPSDTSLPTTDELRRPFIDVRRMLGVAALLFMLAMTGILVPPKHPVD